MLLALALGAGGCVSKGRYELLETQLTASRSAMSARSLKATQDLRALEEELAEVQAEIARRQTQLDELTARGEDQAVQMGQLNELLGRLRAEVEVLRAKLPPPSEEEPEAPAVLAVDDRVAAGLAALVHLEQHNDAHARSVALVEKAFAPVVTSERAEVLVVGRDVIVRVPMGQLFQEGWTTLSPRGELLATDLATSLKSLPGRVVRVEGHTDTRPRHSGAFASNWERGFASALTLVRALELAEAPVDLVVGSWGGSRPLVDGDDADANKVNARLELVIDAHPSVLDAFSPTPPDPDAEEPADDGPKVLQAPADDEADEAPPEEAAPDESPPEAGKPTMSNE